MRTITFIIIHCTATIDGKDYTAADITRWHKVRGFRTIGYHYVIRRDGTIETGRPESAVGAHCQNHNKHSIGVCYVGGLDAKGQPADTRTSEQRTALLSLLTTLKTRYPHAIIVGHHDLNPQKACPCFDATHEYLQLSNSKH